MELIELTERKKGLKSFNIFNEKDLDPDRPLCPPGHLFFRSLQHCSLE